MPYLMEVQTGEAARQLVRRARPLGPGFPEETALKAEKVEVHASTFTDPGPDWCEFRLFDQSGQLLEKRRVDGY